MIGFCFIRILTARIISVCFIISKLHVPKIFGRNTRILGRKIMENEKANLNYDCNYNLFLAKRFIGEMKRIQDRKYAVMWLRFLMGFNQTIQEMQLRNDFMYYLVLNLQEGYLRPPFDSSPPTSGALGDIANLIPGRIDNTENVEDVIGGFDEPGLEKPMVMSKSPDGGAFLAVQPVPHQGSFCYVAITTRKESS